MHPYFPIHCTINPLNTELNPICHLLALLGAHNILHVNRVGVNVKFGKRFTYDAVEYSNIYISNEMQRYTVYFIWKLLYSGGTTIHHQERKQLYLQHLVFVTSLLLSAAIVEELELV